MPRHRMPPHRTPQRRTLPHLPLMERHPLRAVPGAPVRPPILLALLAGILPLPVDVPALLAPTPVARPREEPGLEARQVMQQEGVRRPLEPEPLAPRTAVKFEPVPTEAAPMCTTPGAAWMSTMVSMAAVASG